MVPGLQIAGLFLAITTIFAFTAWAETWLASAAASGSKRVSKAKQSVARERVEPGNEGEVIRAA